MNKVFNINLGGYPFVIDDIAYNKLDEYLESLDEYFSASEGCEEIVSDIESRMAELFKERLKRRKVVSMKDLNEVIDIMGRPEQFEEDGTHAASGAATSGKNKFDIRTGKRLYRNPDDKVLAGVCSGLSAYLGIEDPIWMRLVFVLAFFGFGAGVIPYIILWAVVPEALTSGDRLSMRGEAANVSNIARTVEDELQNIGQKISNKFKKNK